MPKRISFCFDGYVRGCDLAEVLDGEGKSVNTDEFSAEEIAENLEDGIWTISLRDHINQNTKEQIQFFDFEVEDAASFPLDLKFNDN